MQVLTPGRRTALWLALAALSFPAPALELGSAEVRSGLGEKLDARIPLRAREGEWFHARCLSLAPATTSAPFPPDSTLSVERRRSGTQLRVRTESPINEPAIAFSVRSACAGAAALVGAPVTLLIDPPRVDRAPRPEPSPQPSALREATQPAPSRRATPAIAAPQRVPERPAAAAPPARPAQPVERASPDASAVAPPATNAAAGRGSNDFVLRLSSGDIDLSRTRQFDEGSRARLRERLRLLDSDDQVAEMLSMRDNLRRLEARVAELQLKLAVAPPTFPAKAEAPAAEPAKPVPESVKPAAEPVKPAPGPVNPATEAVRPAAEPAKPPPAVKATVPVEAPASPEKSFLGALESFQGRLIALGLAILVLLAMLGAWLWSRWRHPPAPGEEEYDDEGPKTVVMDPEEIAPAQDPIEIAPPAPPARVEVTSDAALATRLDEDTEALRRRYIEERFPEIRAGTIALGDPGSVVKGARLFHEDGAMPRAVELLRFAIEDRPAELRPWLALFEIYRLERLPGEYGELAARFRDRHGDSDKWPKVRAFGRELEPGNALYQEPAVNSLETIGPRAARRIAAAQADPVTENWLEAPMDFENEVLASELRRSLMARARVDERDLASNPMPALRSVEMFSVG